MKILLVNVDAKWNMAIRKLYNYYRAEHEVDMVDLGMSGYPHDKYEVVNAIGYDKVFVSNIFENNMYRMQVIGCNNIEYGGVGSRDQSNKLPKEIDDCEPFYFDYEDTSYGFITRGCIRNCYFCKVPKHEGKLYLYRHPSQIIKHKKAVFHDNNILAYDKHKEILKWLVDHHDVKVEFNQGIDFRLTDEENLELLAALNYAPHYTFAFDDIRHEQALNKKMPLMKKHIPQDWKLRFFLYANPKDSPSDLVHRIKWCRENRCLPYVMRDFSCWSSENRDFYTDIAAYCNQPNMFKKKTFDEFMEKRTSNEARRNKSISLYRKEE